MTMGGRIVLNIRDSIAPGLIVYDVTQQRVGNVASVDADAGRFVVRTDDIPHLPLYLPFDLITNIDPRDLFVSLPVLELYQLYASP